MNRCYKYGKLYGLIYKRCAGRSVCGVTRLGVSMRLAAVIVIVCLFSQNAGAKDDSKAISIGQAADQAIMRSKLPMPGSSPFHLKAKIAEVGEPDSDYQAEIEEFWVSPLKWRRVIHSPDFSQTLVINGEKISEQNTGNYFPFWLRDLVTAIFDPLPMVSSLKQASGQVQKPTGSDRSTSCVRFESKVGVPPAQISAFSVFCFEGGQGLLDSVVTPTYSAVFKDYKAFKEKRVARRIVIDPEPGTTIEARISELTELANPDSGLFEVRQVTPESERLKTVPVSEDALRGLSLEAPDIAWPPIKGGKTSGVLSMYISVDKSGQVREAWPLNSDNADLEGPAREQVKKWRFKPASVNGASVQVESVLTFVFNTKTE
jgi:hypothetical protein